MKYTTQELYGIDAKQLANMRTYDYLQKTKWCAIKRREEIIFSKPMHELTSEEQEMVKYLDKAIKGREFLLNEMEQ